MRVSPSRRACARVASFLGLAACLGVAGCGGSPASVSGKITYNGKALKGGYVTFVSTSGGVSGSGTINEDGTYKVENIRTGEYKVCVDTTPMKAGATKGPQSGKMAKMMPHTPKGGGPPPGAELPEGYKASNPGEAAAASMMGNKRYVEIPAKYAKEDTTDYVVTVTGMGQQLDIELK